MTFDDLVAGLRWERELMPIGIPSPYREENYEHSRYVFSFVVNRGDFGAVTLTLRYLYDYPGRLSSGDPMSIYGEDVCLTIEHCARCPLLRLRGESLRPLESQERGKRYSEARQHVIDKMRRIVMADPESFGLDRPEPGSEMKEAVDE